MKKLIIAAVLTGSAIACGNPLTPSYTCTTQPRQYVLPSGVSQWEVDTYTQNTPCPARPID